MRISNEVIDILEQCKVHNDKLFLPDFQLDRKLYVKVNKVLELAGGKWNRATKAHLFTSDVGDLLDTLILSGEICDIKKELQYFATPPKIIAQLIEFAGVKGGDLVLEPSAGEGHIAKKLLSLGCSVDTCEIHEPFRDKLLEMGCRIYTGDFLKFHNGNYYKHVIANPPFTRQQDIDHVSKMIDVCCGRITSVMSASILFRDNKKTSDFRRKIALMGGRFVSLPENSFKTSGTGVNACIVIVDVPMNK